MTFIWYIFIPAFVLVLGMIVFLDKRNEKINHNIVNIKAKLLAESDRGDEFASLFNVGRLYEDTALHPKYSFLEKFGYDKKLVIGTSEEKFWKAYVREKEQFTKESNYRLYKLFVNNVGYKGQLAEKEGVFYFTISKTKPDYSYMFQNCTSLTKISFPKSLAVGYSPSIFYKAPTTTKSSTPFPKVNSNSLDRPGFEKIRTIWQNTTEDEDTFTFIIKADEAEDFCNMCELICGDDLSW